MHLHDDLRARWEVDTRAVGNAAAPDPGTQPPTVIGCCSRADAGSGETCPADPRLGRILGLGSGDIGRENGEQQHVVHAGRRPRMDLEADEILGRRQPRIDEEAVVVVADGRVRLVGGARIERGAGRAEIGDAAGCRRQRRGFRRISGGRARLRQAARVAISVAARRRDPWKSPQPSAGSHGGISPDPVEAATAAARGFASS